MQSALLALSGLLVVLAAAQLLSRWTRLPPASAQLLLGAAVTNLIVLSGVDTGLRHDNFDDLALHLLLPLVVYAGATGLSRSRLRAILLPAGLLASIGLLGSITVTAGVLYVIIDHPTGFPLLAAMLTAILLAAYDPAAIYHDRDDAVMTLLESESMLGDALVMVLFSACLGLALMPELPHNLSLVAGGEIAYDVAISIVIGIAAGAIQRGFTAVASRSSELPFWLSLAAAYGSYHVAILGDASGVLACLICALAANPQGQSSQSTWPLLNTTATGLLFALVGATVTLSMFTERWFAMLAGIVSVVAARWICVHLLLSLSNIRSRVTFDFHMRNRAALSGMRGTLAIALVLLLPVELSYWWTIQSIVYGVVLFDVLIAAPLIIWRDPNQRHHDHA